MCDLVRGIRSHQELHSVNITVSHVAAKAAKLSLCHEWTSTDLEDRTLIAAAAYIPNRLLDQGECCHFLEPWIKVKLPQGWSLELAQSTKAAKLSI